MQEGPTQTQQWEQNQSQRCGGTDGIPAPQHNGADGSFGGHPEASGCTGPSQQQLESDSITQVAKEEAAAGQDASGGDAAAIPGSIVLRIEYAQPLETKLVGWTMVSSVAIAIALIALIELQSGAVIAPFTEAGDGGGTVILSNFVTGCIMSMLAVSLLGLAAAKWLWFTHFRVHWDHRRRRVCAIKAVELMALTASLLAWTVASGTSAEGSECRAYNTRLVAVLCVRLTCYNVLLLMWVSTARGMRCWRQAGSGAPGPKIAPHLRRDAHRAFSVAAGRLCAAAARAFAAAAAAACAATAAALCKGRATSLPAAARRAIRLPATSATAGAGNAATGACPAPAPTPGPASLDLDQVAEGAVTLEFTLAAGQVADAEQPSHSHSKPSYRFTAAEAGPTDQRSGGRGGGTAPEQAEQLYVDAPWLTQMKAGLLLFVPYQGIIVTRVVLLFQRIPGPGYAYPDGCLDWFVECSDNTRQLLLTSLTVCCFIAYLIVYTSQCWMAFTYLESRSYMQHRALNIALRVEVRIRGLVFLFLVAFELVEGYASPLGPGDKCVISADTLVGLWPVQAVCSLLVAGLAWLMMPRAVDRGLPVMQETLQAFAWSEHELPARRANRLASLPPGSCYGAAVQEAPMFCFETAVKLCYWSQFAYYHGEECAPYRIPLERLMALYSLDEIEVVYEEESDAKAVVAWSGDTILVCFRGTASLKAACVDVKAYLAPYHDCARWRARYRWASLAAVHHGFQWSWRHNGFSARVLARVRALRLAHPHAQVMVTGHSLGGAHAVLCALEIMAQELFEAPVQQPIRLCCYTFGAPRVGNHTLSGLYDKVVKELWNVVNQNDLVALTPKYVAWFVYKHPGHKVVAKRSGDLIVRPNFVESSVMRLPCARSVVNHTLSSYMTTCMAVLHGQLHHRHMEGGLRGLLQLTSFGLPEIDDLMRMLLEQPPPGDLCGATHTPEDPEATSGTPTELLPSKGAPAAAPSALTLAQQASLQLALRALVDARGAGRRSQQQGQQARAPPPQARQRQVAFLRLLLSRVGLRSELLGVEDGPGTYDPDGEAAGRTGLGGGAAPVRLEVLMGVGVALPCGGDEAPGASAPREGSTCVGHAGGKVGGGGVCDEAPGPQTMEAGCLNAV